MVFIRVPSISTQMTDCKVYFYLFIDFYFFNFLLKFISFHGHRWGLFMNTLFQAWWYHRPPRYLLFCWPIVDGVSLMHELIIISMHMLKPSLTRFERYLTFLSVVFWKWDNPWIFYLTSNFEIIIYFCFYLCYFIYLFHPLHNQSGIDLCHNNATEFPSFAKNWSHNFVNLWMLGDLFQVVEMEGEIISEINFAWHAHSKLKTPLLFWSCNHANIMTSNILQSISECWANRCTYVSSTTQVYWNNNINNFCKNISHLCHLYALFVSSVLLFNMPSNKAFYLQLSLSTQVY